MSKLYLFWSLGLAFELKADTPSYWKKTKPKVIYGGFGVFSGACIVDGLYSFCDVEFVAGFRCSACGVRSDWVVRIRGPAILGLEAQSSGVSAATRGVGPIVRLSAVRGGKSARSLRSESSKGLHLMFGYKEGCCALPHSVQSAGCRCPLCRVVILSTFFPAERAVRRRK